MRSHAAAIPRRLCSRSSKRAGGEETAIAARSQSATAHGLVGRSQARLESSYAFSGDISSENRTSNHHASVFMELRFEENVGTGTLKWRITDGHGRGSIHPTYPRHDFSGGFRPGDEDVARDGDNGKVWASRMADGGLECLDQTYSNAVHAVTVRVRPVDNSGAIIPVDLWDAAGAAMTVFQGVDPQTYAANQIGWHVATFPRTPSQCSGSASS